MDRIEYAGIRFEIVLHELSLILLAPGLFIGKRPAADRVHGDGLRSKARENVERIVDLSAHIFDGMDFSFHIIEKDKMSGDAVSRFGQRADDHVLRSAVSYTEHAYERLGFRANPDQSHRDEDSDAFRTAGVEDGPFYCLDYCFVFHGGTSWLW